MVLYECFRCGYSTKQKTHFINHLNRKNICNPTEDDIGIDEIKKYYGFEVNFQIDPKKPQIDPKKPQIDPKKPNIDPEKPQIEDPKKPEKTPNSSENNPKKPQKTPNEPICIYCNKIYSKMCHLRRHEKNCKKKK